MKEGKSGGDFGGRSGRGPGIEAGTKAVRRSTVKVAGGAGERHSQQVGSRLADGQADSAFAARSAQLGPAGRDVAADPVAETAVLLDTVIHDLRTPLSAMSGWLEVLEAHFGEADGIVGRALLGLRRGVDSQTKGLNALSDVLMKQRIDLPSDGDCLLLERMQSALIQMNFRGDSPLDSAKSARLEPFRSVDPSGSLICKDAGSSLGDACETLLHALAVSQTDADGPMSIAGNADKVLITVPGGSGDASPLKGLCQGLEGYATRHPEIRAQALWLARSVLQRCGLALQMSPASGGGFNLLLSRVCAL